MKKLIFLLVLLSPIFNINNLLASPSIINISTSEQDNNCRFDGAEVLITGLSFGDSGMEIPLLWDKVENISAYDGLNNGDTVTEDVWQLGTYGSSMTISTTNPRGGSSKHYLGNGKSYLEWPDLPGGTNLDQIYISWWYKPSKNPYGDGGSNKFLRIWDNPNGDESRISWTSMHMTYGPDSGGSPSWGSHATNAGAWNYMELWARSNGKIKATVNGKIIHDASDFLSSGSAYGLNIKLIGFDPSITTPYYADMVTEIDDIYVSGSRARVELSASNTWDAKSHRETQIPIEWSNTEIRFIVNEGDLNLNNTYLYVFDDEGNASNAIPFICKPAPMPPAGVEISVP